ncbi:MAG: N-6 DNA methylase [Flavobacteriales bacterium]|nr:MAG: N-6 DNA methylase [Flavobacteriales bacterium]
MLDSITKRRIDDCRDILVGKVPDPKSQIDQITVALIYKFMHDMDQEAVELGGSPTFFAAHTVVVNGKKEVKDYTPYAWPNLMATNLGGEDRVKLYAEALERMPENPGLPQLFRDIFKNTYLPYRDPATLREFLKRISEFTYDHSEKLGDAFEYLLSIMGSQGDAGQFRTPRHLIDFMTAVIDPQKHETIMDPACGTAGFLISAYKHILRHNSSNLAADDPLAFQLHGVKQEDLTVSAKKYAGDKLSPDDRKRLVRNIVGYDIDPGMVKLALVNLYLHGFPEPHIFEYDTLTSTDRWEERFDVVLANPPFMSPKGGIKPHGKFGIPSTRSEVLFVDYIAEHLNPNGRALIVVPEGIIFQSGNAYKALRKKLVDEHYLVGVLSVPGGVFNPYSGVKTSLLWFDRALARKTDKLLFVKVENDGFDLGAQRRPIAQNDLPEAFALMTDYKRALVEGMEWEAPKGWEAKALQVERERIGANAEYSLSGDRFLHAPSMGAHDVRMVPLGELADLEYGYTESASDAGDVRFLRITDIDEHGRLREDGAKYITLTDASRDYLVKKDDLLVARTGATYGKTLLIEKDADAVFASYLIRIRLKAKDVLPKYYWLFTQTDEYKRQAARLATGGGQPQFNGGALKQLQIPLPPLAEQEALVAEVEAYQKVIDGARQVVAHYKPRITIDPSWEMVELGEVVQEAQYGLSEKMNTDGKGWKCFRMSEIQGGLAVDTGEMKCADISEQDLLKYRLYPGDILFNRTNSYEHVGKTGIFELQGDYVFASYLVRLKMKDGVNPWFINYVVNTDSFQADLKRFVSRAIGQANINVRSLQTCLVPLPPLGEQERIVAALEEERRMVEGCHALIKRMEAKVRERVARVWSSSPTASAADGDGGSDDQRVQGSEHTKPGQGHSGTAVPPMNYNAPDMQLNAAAEPPSANGTAHPTERRKPGRPPKGDATTAQAQEAIATYLSTHPGWHGKSGVLEATGVDAANWNAAISALLESGKVERQGEKRGARYRGR